MKLRRAAVLVAAVLLMATAMTAFAQPSAEAQPVSILSVIDKSNEVMDNTKCHEVRIKALTGAELEAAKAIVTEEGLKTILSVEDAQKNWATFMFDAYVYDTKAQKEVDWKEGEHHFPITVTFKVPGVTAKSNVEVLHYYENWHTEDKVKDIVIGEGTVTVTFAHLSPVVIMVENQKTPPQTGDNNMTLYIVLAASISLVGIMVASKKRTNS